MDPVICSSFVKSNIVDNIIAIIKNAYTFLSKYVCAYSTL